MLLWQTSQTINFAQGEFVMLPAFFVLAAMKFGGLSFSAALLVGLLAALLVLGLLFKRLVVDPILRHGVLPLVISTLGLAIFFKEGVKEFYAAEAQSFPGVWPTTNVTIFGAVISAQSLVIIGVAVVAVGLPPRNHCSRPTATTATAMITRLCAEITAPKIVTLVAGQTPGKPCASAA